MALVTYDNSDSSEYEDEGEVNAPVVLLNKNFESKHGVSEPKPSSIKQIVTSKEEDSQETQASLFNFLPQPSTKKKAVIEEDDEFLHKKAVNNVKQKAKITVPSLSDFKDVEPSMPVAKPRATNGKKSGLLSMLPQPKNGVTATTKSLIPHVLTKKPASVAATNNKSVPIKKAKLDTTPLVNDYSDDSDTEEVENDFFSIHKPVEIPDDVNLPLDIEGNLNKEVDTEKPSGIERFFKKEEAKVADQDYLSFDTEQGESSSSYNDGTENNNSNNLELDEEAIMKLCGTRGKRKREDIQIVDVNQQEVLANAREMLLKGLMEDTTQRVSASKKKGNEPTTQQRRKHQITYLAHQAKANEAELQKQWANNRMSKRQTQAKYGF